MTQQDETSQTIPRRRSSRDAERMATLSIVGSPSNIDSLRAARLMTLFGDGAEIGRRPPPGRRRTVITLADRSVSSYHAQISRAGDDYVIEDKGSTNGTLVDGRPVKSPTVLREGAVVFLGSQVLVFRTMTAAEIAAVETDMVAPFAPIPTLSRTLAIVCGKLRRLAPSPTELFLLGETGVGKEVFANAIHAASGRKGRLMAVNCAALPRELVESELFGYERGAHSTAKDRKAGLIEAADRGTLFLDELAEMPLDVQSKLLRFLQDRKYTPIGSTRLETADVRIIAASSRVAGIGGDPAIQDALMGRLGAQPIQLPPLRERMEDVGRLVAYFLDATGSNRPIEPEAFQALFLYSWPHNIRELQKVITEAELLSRDSDAIGFDHLPPGIVDALEALDAAPSPGGSGPISARGGGARQRRAVPTADELRALMRQYRGNVQQVSNHLDRQWAVIWRVLRRYGIDPAEFRPSGADAGNDAQKRGSGDQITAELRDDAPAGDQSSDQDGSPNGDEDGDTLA